jgi:transposase-like protein
MSQRETTSTSWNGSRPKQQPDPEVLPRAKRRQFSAGYKLRVLQEVDDCSEAGQIGALLRREGLYSSQLSEWRRAREAGQLQALSGQKPGALWARKAEAQATEMATLRRENEQLKAQLVQADLIIAAQKKLALALEQTLSLSKEKSS